jgi:hypothetical protein
MTSIHDLELDSPPQVHTSTSAFHHPPPIPGPAGTVEVGGDHLSSTTLAPLSASWAKTASWTVVLLHYSSSSLAAKTDIHKLLTHCSTATFPPKVKTMVLQVVTLEARNDDGDVGAVFVDNTGSIEGTLSAALFHLPSFQHLQVGSCLLLQNVPVLSLAPWSHHLIITPPSFVLMHSPGDPSSE